MNNNIMEILKIRKLRESQEAPLAAARSGKDIFVRYPTAAGKSLLGQVPALEDELGFSIVLSPLLALQRDNSDKLAAKGLSVFLLNSDLSKAERDDILEKMRLSVGRTLIYMGPEQLVKEDVGEALAAGGCRRIIVDEAHLILSASKRFRPEFKQIRDVIDKLPRRPQIIALTATITPTGMKKVKKILRCPEAEEFLLPVRRSDLHVDMLKLSGKKRRESIQKAVLNCLKQQKKLCKTLVYCQTRSETEDMYKFLNARKYKVTMIHGGTSPKEREKQHEKFASGRSNIMVSTTAYGLGIDIPDIRLVIHAGLPLTFEGYVQEIGRASRDGQSATCFLIYHEGDFARCRNILSCGGKKRRRKAIKKVQAMKDAVTADVCIWQLVDEYFQDSKGTPCGACPACLRESMRQSFKLCKPPRRCRM